MFTGIVQSAQIQLIVPDNNGWNLTVQAPEIAKRVQLGDSVAIDGACLSVTKIAGDSLQFYVSLESIDKTIIQFYQEGSRVNLELPVQVNGHLGGHYVLGHVDATGLITNIDKGEQSWNLSISFPEQFSKYVVYKGSITINGISLTVNKVLNNSVDICIIPVTLEKTNLQLVNQGDKVNVEFDILAKYTEKLLINKENQERV